MEQTESVLDKFINKNATRGAIYMEMIEEMMGQPQLYGYAESLLVGIYDYIDKNNTITDGQCRAIENVKAKPTRQYGRRR